MEEAESEGLGVAMHNWGWDRIVVKKFCGGRAPAVNSVSLSSSRL